MPNQGTRRLVTCLFCDVAGSTALGSELDPESVRGVMERFFAQMRAAAERHGGTVEKFIGDAVLIVFGVPELHEDDALRAVRASVDMGEALELVNAEIAERYGVTIRTRTGIASGEVLAAPGPQEASFVTGRAVNLAARLQQAAGPGEVVLSATTRHLVRDAVETEPIALELKGIGDEVEAHRLLRLIPGSPGHARRADATLVDREGELGLLLHAYERAEADAGCHLATVLGSPGVGKSRLAAELVHRVGDRATVLYGRCPPYGEGITFSPVAEAIAAAAGLTSSDTQEQVRAKVAASVAGAEEGGRIAELAAQAIGVPSPAGVASTEEMLRGLRRYFAALARRSPLILVFDDVQWGEPTFLDLIEQTAEWLRDAPVMIVCPARPELLELRPGWAGGQRNALTIHLEPLSAAESETLVDRLLGGGTPEDARRAIVSASGGNALFAEEIVSMLIEAEMLVREGRGWTVTADLARVELPPTIAALVASRIDRLSPDERDVVERAAIVGERFSIGSILALGDGPDDEDLAAVLGSLERKELVRMPAELDPDTPARFRHLVIRDVTYGSIPKQRRVEAHQRYADWLEERAGDRLDEVEELVGYHLEQAHRYRAELGAADEALAELAARAGRRLAAAGARAAARGDMPATTNLLTRADALLPDDDAPSISALPDLADALFQAGEIAKALGVLDRMRERAERFGFPSLAALALLERSSWELVVDPRSVEADRFREVTSGAIRAFTEEGATRRLASAYESLAMYHRFFTGDMAAMAEAAERGLEVARAATDQAAMSGAALQLGRALVMGPPPCDEALGRLSELGAAFDTERMLSAAVQLDASILRAALGATDDARAGVAEARAVFEELGQHRWLAEVSSVEGEIERAAGDPERAADHYRRAFEEFRRRGEGLDVALAAGALGVALSDLGRHDEADELMREIAGASPPGSVEPGVSLERLRARALAARGELDRAGEALEVALAIASATSIVALHGEVALDLAAVLREAGRDAAARSAADVALGLYRAKRDVAAAARAEAFLAGGQAS